MLQKLRYTTGSAKRKLKAKATQYRKRMIAANKRHAEDALPKKKFNERALRNGFTQKYAEALAKVESTAEGRKALRRYRSFTGLPFPPEIKTLNLPGPKNKKVVLVGMGKSPEVQLADGDEYNVSKIKKLKGKRIAATDATGKRIYILSGRNAKAEDSKLKFVGYAPETHYVLTPGEEKAGTFKRGKYWIHSHADSGGKWPKVYQDQVGNFVYGPGTYRVGKWIQR
jgi:hypothetical protein